MNKLKLFFLLFFCAVYWMIFSQSNNVFDFKQRSEAYFSFQINTPKDLSTITNLISIDKVEGNTIYAYANETSLNRFLELGYSIEIHTAPSLLHQATMKNWNEIQHQKNDWNYYPTYEAYIAMMHQFATDYPTLCQTVNFGTTNENRELLACKISANVSAEEAEPQVFYTSSIHGDEVTGYVLMLRFIDYLLSHYGNDTEITDLLDHLEIWICPLANPDGTFHDGNNSVNGATRANAHGVDLNRNFKDFVYGNHPDNESWQVETEYFMEFQAQHDFVLGFNIHGGSEVLNYPWDNNAALHADNNWWQLICREYVDTVHLYSSDNYMTEVNNGITNGFSWYQITGSRQDYTNYYDGNREFTLEISMDKTPIANNLPIFWNYNYRSMINLLKQANYGIQGVITDCETQQPVKATIFVENHDAVYSIVTSNATNGTYYRPIKAGSYNVTYSAEGYYPQTFSIEISDRETFIQNVELCQGSLIANFSSDVQSTPIHTSVHFSDETFGNPISWEWTFFGGSPYYSDEQNPTVLYETEGSFDVMLVVTKTVAKEILTDTIIKHHYITANNQFIIQNGTFTTCSGLFLDDGGLEMNYLDNKDYQITFYPADPTAQLQFDFLDFATENNYDFLKIYDASSNTASALIGSYSGTNSPGIVTATNNEGALTFVFSSDRNTNDRGWKAAISCQGGEMKTPIAVFSANVLDINIGESVHFTDESSNNPTSWFWTFEGGTPPFSFEQNPNVTYTNEGTYNVTLTVSNSMGNDTKVITDFISVSLININEETIENQVTIFPNPAFENALIQSKTDIQKIEIYNTLGQLLKETHVNSNTYQLTTNDLNSGLYLIRMFIRNQVITKRLVILK